MRRYNLLIILLLLPLVQAGIENYNEIVTQEYVESIDWIGFDWSPYIEYSPIFIEYNGYGWQMVGYSYVPSLIELSDGEYQVYKYIYRYVYDMNAYTDCIIQGNDSLTCFVNNVLTDWSMQLNYIDLYWHSAYIESLKKDSKPLLPDEVTFYLSGDVKV